MEDPAVGEVGVARFILSSVDGKAYEFPGEGRGGSEGIQTNVVRVLSYLDTVRALLCYLHIYVPRCSPVYVIYQNP